LAGETIHVGCEVAGLRSVDADGIATHIIGGDDEHIEALGGGAGGRGDSDENGGEQDEATGKEGGHGWGGERGDGERERGGEGEKGRGRVRGIRLHEENRVRDHLVAALLRSR
jgi:hypothetical protein